MLWNLSGDSRKPVSNNKEMTPDINVILPYPIAQNNDEMEKNILEFNEEQYLSRMRQFEREVELVFDGRASARTGDLLESYMSRHRK